MKSPILAAIAATVLLAGAASAEVVYHHHHHRLRHVVHHASAIAAGTQVWVNLDTGIFHLPGERWYGNTRNGTYMSEKQALADGYRETENGQ